MPTVIMAPRLCRGRGCSRFTGITLAYLLSLFFLQKVPEAEAMVVLEELSILPTFNVGMRSQIKHPETKALVAKVVSAEVRYTKEQINVRIQYEALTNEFYANCFLNGSDFMAEFIRYKLQIRRRSSEYMADIYIKRRRQYGLFMLSFKLEVRKFTDCLMVQYAVNLQDSGNRAVTKGCPSSFHIFPSIKTMLIQFSVEEFTPMHIRWEKIIVFKRVYVRAMGVSLIHLPLLVVTRKPFKATFLTLWSFQDFVGSFGTSGFLRLQGSTIDSVGVQETGGYTVRWFISENQHLIDEYCPEQLLRLPVSPGPPLFFYLDPKQSDHWKTDLDKLSRLVSERKSLTLLVACAMTDVYQVLSDQKEFTTVWKGRLLYSVGDDLGYLAYAYNVTLNSPTLEKFDCITTTTKGVPFIPLTRDNEVSVYPPIAGTEHATRFVLTLTFACTHADRKVAIKGVYISGPEPTTDQIPLQGNMNEWAVCKTPRRNFEVVVSTWKKDDVYTITASVETKDYKKVVIMGPYDKLTVEPSIAFAGWSVEIKCFEGLLAKLSAPSKEFAEEFNTSKVEYLVLEGLNQTEYLPLLKFTPTKGYVPQTEHIDSLEEIVNANATGHPYIHVKVRSQHLTNYSGFRCRLKMKNTFNQEYSVITRKPVCYVLRPPRLRIAIQNIFLPKVSNELVLDKTRLENYQLSCVRPGQDIEIACQQKSVIVECANCPTIEEHFESVITVLVAMKKTNKTRVYKPVLDRSGRAKVLLKKLDVDMHQAIVVCKQVLFDQNLTAKKDKTKLFVQYTGSAKLCVSRLAFDFYKLQLGFDEKKGLLTTVARAKKLAKTEYLDTAAMHSIPARSAILCVVITDYPVFNTQMTVQSGVENFKAAKFELPNASLLILPQYTQELKDQPITVTCATIRKQSRIPGVSKELRFVIEEHELDNATAVDEFVLLMKMVSTTLLLGLLVAILCPLCTMIADHRYEKRKLQKHREKQKAIESLLTLKLDVEKEAKAKARTAAATESANEGDRANPPSVTRHTRSARQSMAMISDIMRAQALKRASSHSLGDVGPKGHPTEAMDGNTSEQTMSGRKTEVKKRTQPSSQKKSKFIASSRTKTLKVSRPTYKGSTD